MKEKNLKNKSSENRFTSGEDLTESEFTQGIESAEKGSFYTVQESMKRFESFKQLRKVIQTF